MINLCVYTDKTKLMLKCCVQKVFSFTLNIHVLLALRITLLRKLIYLSLAYHFSSSFVHGILRTINVVCLLTFIGTSVIHELELKKCYLWRLSLSSPQSMEKKLFASLDNRSSFGYNTLKKADAGRASPLLVFWPLIKIHCISKWKARAVEIHWIKSILLSLADSLGLLSKQFRTCYPEIQFRTFEDQSCLKSVLKVSVLNYHIQSQT